MESAFWYKLFLSFVVGSVWVSLSTLAAERFGSKIGGLIGGLPSTAAVALLFIGLTQSPRTASEATTVMPIAMGFNGTFLIVYLFSISRGLAVSLIGSLMIWFLQAYILALIGIRTFWISLSVWLLLLLFCYATVERMNISSQSSISVHCTVSQILLRALFGGGVIAFAVLIGKLGGPLYGGIFATFPAMFLSTLLITYRTGGSEFSRAVAKALMVSGMINIVLYVIAVRYLYLWLGLAFGTTIALVIASCTGYLTYLFMKVKVT